MKNKRAMQIEEVKGVWILRERNLERSEQFWKHAPALDTAA